MKWVGILYINKNSYLNGKYYSKTWDQLINKLFLNQHQLPLLMLVYINPKLISPDQINQIYQQLLSKCKVIIYYQSYGCVYIHRDKIRYIISVLMGGVIGSVLCLISGHHILKKESLVKTNIIYDRISNNMSSIGYKKIMKQLSMTCQKQQCVSELAIFPNQIMVRLIHESYMPSFIKFGCNSYKNGVMMCEIQ
jgi:hypothetical protein